ncbi:MAG: hypothetical protein AAGD38_14890, partial [Acidobacteriota bacterium]
IEPGTFDLAGSTLVMRDFVDISGSGRNSTHVQSSAPVTIQAPAGIDAELRELTVENDRANAGPGTGLLIQAEKLVVTLVNIEVENVTTGTGVQINATGRPRLASVFSRVSALDVAFGVDILGDGAVITELFVFILSFSTTTNIGLIDRSTGESVIDGVSGFVAGATQFNIGIDVFQASPRISNNQWTADSLGSPATAVGLFVATGGAVTNPLVRESSFVALDSANQTWAIDMTGSSQLQFQHSLARADGAGSIGLVMQNTSVANIDESIIEGGNASFRTAAATSLQIGGTKLTGPRFPGGFTFCAQSYDGITYVDLPNGPCL